MDEAAEEEPYIRIDSAARRVFVRGEERELTKREFDLLEFFASNLNVVFGRDVLYERVWGAEALSGAATVSVHVNRLREKLERDASAPEHIVTVRGSGYRYVP